FLDSIETHKEKLPLIYTKSLLGSRFNQMEYFTKPGVRSTWGISFITLLQKVGQPKLEALVEATSGLNSTEKKQLKKNIPIILRYAFNGEGVHGKKFFEGVEAGFYPRVSQKQKEANYDRQVLNMLKRDINDYPYVPASAMELLFDFMAKVFPVDNSFNLKPSPAYDPASPHYITRDPSVKLRLNGFPKGLPPGSPYKSVNEWAEKEPNLAGSELVARIQKKKPEEIDPSLNFESVIKIA
ncbi:3231_t:CDS:1, partial [Cetraspora pellucida]